MKLPAWLAGILFTGWTIWSNYYYFCHTCGCCGDAPAVNSLPSLPTLSSLTGAPLFKWNDSSPQTGELFAAWKAKTLLAGGQGDTLTITGFYRKDEVNNSAHPNLGMARAAAMRPMFPDIPDSRIRLAGKLVEDDMNQSDPHESAEFAWAKMDLKKDEGAIIETGNTATILFPFNSTAKDRDPKVDAFLKSLCDKHKSGNATLTIVGHTDNVGDEAANHKLGLGRADAIRRILRDCGLASERVKAESKGEAEPVADNNTDTGRHQNRRVVITINQ